MSSPFITVLVEVVGGGGVSKRVSERDPLKYDNQMINRGDRRLICHGRCYNVITTNVIKPIK